MKRAYYRTLPSLHGANVAEAVRQQGFNADHKVTTARTYVVWVMASAMIIDSISVSSRHRWLDMIQPGLTTYPAWSVVQCSSTAHSRRPKAVLRQGCHHSSSSSSSFSHYHSLPLHDYTTVIHLKSYYHGCTQMFIYTVPTKNCNPVYVAITLANNVRF